MHIAYGCLCQCPVQSHPLLQVFWLHSNFILRWTVKILSERVLVHSCILHWIMPIQFLHSSKVENHWWNAAFPKLVPNMIMINLICTYETNDSNINHCLQFTEAIYWLAYQNHHMTIAIFANVCIVVYENSKKQPTNIGFFNSSLKSIKHMGILSSKNVGMVIICIMEDQV